MLPPHLHDFSTSAQTYVTNHDLKISIRVKKICGVQYMYRCMLSREGFLSDSRERHLNSEAFSNANSKRESGCVFFRSTTLAISFNCPARRVMIIKNDHALSSHFILGCHRHGSRSFLK